MNSMLHEIAMLDEKLALPCLLQVAAVVQSLEENLELLCVTGVEDQLQVSLELWLLTEHPRLTTVEPL